MMSTTFALAILGFFLSLYAHRIGELAGKKKNFVAACDINERVSCSKAFSSKYSKHFGVSNGIWGMVFYFMVAIFALFNEVFYVFILSSIALAISIYLAYMLFARVKVTCVVCVATYLINLLIFFISYRVILL